MVQLRRRDPSRHHAKVESREAEGLSMRVLRKFQAAWLRFAFRLGGSKVASTTQQSLQKLLCADIAQRRGISHHVDLAWCVTDNRL